MIHKTIVITIGLALVLIAVISTVPVTQQMVYAAGSPGVGSNGGSGVGGTSIITSSTGTGGSGSGGSTGAGSSTGTGGSGSNDGSTGASSSAGTGGSGSHG